MGNGADTRRDGDGCRYTPRWRRLTSRWGSPAGWPYSTPKSPRSGRADAICTVESTCSISARRSALPRGRSSTDLRTKRSTCRRNVVRCTKGSTRCAQRRGYRRNVKQRLSLSGSPHEWMNLAERVIELVAQAPRQKPRLTALAIVPAEKDLAKRLEELEETVGWAAVELERLPRREGSMLPPEFRRRFRRDR